MLEPGTTAEDGIFNFKQSASAHGGIGARDLPANDMEVQTLIDAHKAPDYIDFVAHRDLRSFVRRLMGWDKEVLLQRTMLRHNVPGADTTAVHYDKLFLRGGEAFFLTAWVPIGTPCFPISKALQEYYTQHHANFSPLLGDISQIGGGLVYLADSVALGKSIEDDFTARAVEMTPEERRSAFNVNMERGGMLSQNATEFADEHDRHWWLAANYEAGDVVFHDPYMIHTSSVNKDPTGKIRLSTDLRFYRQGDDMDKRWMKYWTPGDGL